MDDGEVLRAMARDRYRCRNCHSYVDPHLHHIEFRKEGGNSDLINLVVLCRACHSLVHREKLKIEVDAGTANKLSFLAAKDIPVTRPPRAALKIHVSGERGGRPPRASAASRFNVEW